MTNPCRGLARYGTMRKMNDDVGLELARLRARAYGPGADITDDPAALARLAELERREQDARLAAAEAASAPPAVSTDVLSSGLVDERDAEPVGSGEPAASGDPDASSRRWRLPIRTRRGLWAWALTVVVVAALSSAATAVGSAFVPVARSADVAQVATLTPDPGRAVPGIFGPAGKDGRAYADFHGMTAFVAYAQFGPDGERNPCIFLVPTAIVDQLESGNYAGGYSDVGCGAGVFPATTQFVVNSTSPAEFVARFPPGSSVQFVFDGQNLGVFSDAG